MKARLAYFRTGNLEAIGGEELLLGPAKRGRWVGTPIRFRVDEFGLRLETYEDTFAVFGHPVFAAIGPVLGGIGREWLEAAGKIGPTPLDELEERLKKAGAKPLKPPKLARRDR